MRVENDAWNDRRDSLSLSSIPSFLFFPLSLLLSFISSVLSLSEFFLTTYCLLSLSPLSVSSLSHIYLSHALSSPIFLYLLFLFLLFSLPPLLSFFLPSLSFSPFLFASSPLFCLVYLTPHPSFSPFFFSSLSLYLNNKLFLIFILYALNTHTFSHSHVNTS